MDDVFALGDEALVLLLARHDLPFAHDPPHSEASPERYNKSLWFRLINPDSRRSYRGPHREAIVTQLLQQCPTQLRILLIFARDGKGREVLALADKATRGAMNSFIYFCGRYFIDWHEPPLHVSESSILVRAVDHQACRQYEAVFDSLQASPSELELQSHSQLESQSQSQLQPHTGKSEGDNFLISIDQLIVAMQLVGGYSRVEDEKRRTAVRTDMQKVFKKAGKEALNRADFLQFCCHVVGDTKRVVIKFMMRRVRRFVNTSLDLYESFRFYLFWYYFT